MSSATGSLQLELELEGRIYTSSGENSSDQQSNQAILPSNIQSLPRNSNSKRLIFFRLLDEFYKKLYETDNVKLDSTQNLNSLIEDFKQLKGLDQIDTRAIHFLDCIKKSCANEKIPFNEYSEPILTLVNTKSKPYCDRIGLELLLHQYKLNKQISNKPEFSRTIFLLSSSYLEGVVNFVQNSRKSKVAIDKSLINMPLRLKIWFEDFTAHQLNDSTMSEESLKFLLKFCQYCANFPKLSDIKLNLLKHIVKFFKFNLSPVNCTEKTFEGNIQFIDPVDNLVTPANNYECALYIAKYIEKSASDNLSISVYDTKEKLAEMDNKKREYHFRVVDLLYYCAMLGAYSYFVELTDDIFKYVTVNHNYVLGLSLLISKKPADIERGTDLMEEHLATKNCLDALMILAKNVVLKGHDQAQLNTYFEKIQAHPESDSYTLSYAWMLKGIMHLKCSNQHYDQIDMPIQYFSKAVELDPHNYNAIYHLARAHALKLNIKSAFPAIEKIKLINSEHIIHLKLLIFTAHQDFSVALEILNQHEYLSNRLLYLKGLIESTLGLDDECDKTCRRLNSRSSRASDGFPYNSTIADSFTMSHTTITSYRSLSDLNSRTINRRASMGTMRRYVLSSTNSRESEKTNELNTQSENIEINLLTSVFMIQFKYFKTKPNRPSDTLKKIKEINSKNPEINFLEGLIAKAKGQKVIAKAWFEKYLLLYPFHVPALVELSSIMVDLDELEMAKHYLDSALHIDRSNFKIHKILTVYYEKLDAMEMSLKHSKLAAHLKRSTPLDRFYATDLFVL